MIRDLHVRHRSASGDLTVGWDLLGDGVLGVDVRVTDQAPVVSCALSVCSPRAPREGALTLLRLGEETWRVSPSRWTKVAGIWSTRVALFDARLPTWPLLLSHCPADVAERLAAL